MHVLPRHSIRSSQESAISDIVDRDCQTSHIFPALGIDVRPKQELSELSLILD